VALPARCRVAIRRDDAHRGEAFARGRRKLAAHSRRPPCARVLRAATQAEGNVFPSWGEPKPHARPPRRLV